MNEKGASTLAPQAGETPPALPKSRFPKAAPLHVAEIISDVMRERGWDINTLVDRMGSFPTVMDRRIAYLAWKLFLDVREPEIRIDSSMVQALARLCDVPERFFLDLDEQWRAYALETTHSCRVDNDSTKHLSLLRS